MRLSIVMIFMGCIFLLLPVMIGCYVYKDANRRGMDAPLWTVVVVIVPGLIGLMVYLIVRGNYADASCPVCENEVSNDHVVCPYCGNPLKLCCRNCNTVLEPSWRLCPQCGTQVQGADFAQVKGPEPRKERGLRWLVILLIALPVLVLVVGVVGLMTFRVGAGGSYSTMQSYHGEASSEYISPEVPDWMAECDAQGEGVYLLWLTGERAMQLTQEGDSLVAYVYIPHYQGDEGLLGMMELNGKTMTIEYSTSVAPEDELVYGYELSEIHIIDRSIRDIVIYIDGERVAPVLTRLS